MSNEHGGESSNPPRNGANVDDQEESSSAKQNYHRHTPEQVQRLEEFYRDYPHPDEKQRQQLSQQLGLEMKQVKFWFQNKRTQTKALNERADINSLRRANDKLHGENLALAEALKVVMCGDCKNQHEGEQGNNTQIQKLKQRNEELKEEYARVESSLAYMNSNGKPGQAQLPRLRIAEHHERIAAGQNSNLLQAHNLNSSEKASTMMHYPGPITHETEMKMIEIAKKAMEEVVELVRADESTLWIRSPTDPQTLMIHQDRYNNRFPKASNYLKSRSTRFESSKDSAVVALSAEHLAELFMLPADWVDLFPTIVTKTKTWSILDSEMLGGYLHVMYEQMHTFSPLLAPREFRLLRYIIQLQPSCWMVADVSYDCSTGPQEPSPLCWRLPSGCLIESLPGGNSKVTWVEHVEVDSVCTSRAYGAKLWIATLGRTCERLAYSMGLMKPIHRHELEQVINVPESRRAIMKLSNQMVKDFCKMLTTLDKVNRPQPNNLKNSQFWGSIHPVEPGKPSEGMIIKAAVTVWLPASCPALFSFFTNEHMRSKWDVLSNGNPVNEVAHISCGSHPGNCISILRPFVPNQQQNMIVVQESCIDASGGFIIHSPIAMQTLTVALSGEDTNCMSLQPSGVTITSSDGISIHEGNLRSSNSPRPPHGSFVTVAMQGRIPTESVTDNHRFEESVTTANTLLNSCIQNVKVVLNIYD